MAALVRSNRVMIGGVLLFAIILPELVHRQVASLFDWSIYSRIQDFDKIEIMASVFALLAAHLSLRKISALPFAGDRRAILPAFILSFAGVSAVIGFTIRDFGRYHLTTAFVIGIAWYFLLSVIRARVTRPRLAVVGGLPQGDELYETAISWIALMEPQLPRNVAGIAFDKTRLPGPQFERLFARAVLRQIPVYELGVLREGLTGRVQLHLKPEEEFGALIPSSPYLRIKRYVDLLFALIVLPVILPVLLFFALLVRIESPGPAIFRQQRIGYRGRPFTCFKLRSMRSDLKGFDYTLDDDPRITRIGRFIRRTRIDELPQIFNIIRGEMSWIGPRPEAVSLARAYDRQIPYYGYRHLVRPGISGWAAVHQGNVALPDAAMRKLEYDFYYIKHFSVWLDFLIGLMTIRTILTGSGAR